MRRSPGLSVLIVCVIAFGAFGFTVASGNTPQLGLDLQGGASVVLQPKNKVPGGVLDQAIEIIRSRVDALGVAEPDIHAEGSNIIVQLPGVKNRDRALEVVGQTAQLYFRKVIETLPPESATPTTVPPPPTPLSPDAPPTTAAPAPDPNKTTPPEQNDPNAEVILPNDDGTARYKLAPAQVTGTALSSAEASVDPNTGEWLVQFELTGQGTTDWNKLATEVGVGKQIAIDLDGRVKSAPVLNETSFQGSGQISGDFSEREAKDLALVLEYGALPVQLEPQTVQTISASLGRDSLSAGIAAGVVGLLLVGVYMLLYYRALGIVVWLGLGITGALMYSIVTWLGQTRGLSLTLAGATGIIVSVGVTVDSYVVYFERLKDDLRAGKTIRSSVGRSFSRAYRTILTADTASLIGAVVLYFLSVGSVRGFAFFLGLSTILDMVIAYFFTRPMVALLARNRFFTEARWVGVARGLAATRAAPSIPAAQTPVTTPS